MFIPLDCLSGGADWCGAGVYSGDKSATKMDEYLKFKQAAEMR